MEASLSTDTSSGRYPGQWSFINGASHHGHGYTGLPPSGYLRSDGSSTSPHVGPSAFLFNNGSVSSLSRAKATSIGSAIYSTAPEPSQPILSRIHSNAAVAPYYLNPISRPPQSRPIMSKENELPPLAAFSFEGILGAIQEDIEDDLDGIAEILARNNHALATQYDSHKPPTGEIMEDPLQAPLEDGLVADDFMVQNEEDLLDLSQNGIDAYGILTRAHARPQASRAASDVLISRERPVMPPLEPLNSSPAVFTIQDILQSEPQTDSHSPPQQTFRASLDLLQQPATAAKPNPRNNPIVSEVYLSAGANGITVSDPPTVSEAGRHYPLYSFDESQIFGPDFGTQLRTPLTLRQRLNRLFVLGDLQRAVVQSGTRSASTLLGHGAGSTRLQDSRAEEQLRTLLARRQEPSGTSTQSTHGTRLQNET